MNLKNNLGMYAEEMINRSKNYYLSKNTLYIEKREIPIKIIKKIDEKTIVGKLCSKSFVDYFAIVKNKHVEFEVKQTNELTFPISLLKEHQYNYLINMSKLGIYSFIIVYFSTYGKFILIDIEWLQKYVNDGNKKHIDFSLIQKECKELPIIFPGILDFSIVASQIED